MAFLGGYVAFKVVFPSVVKWLAYDTYTTALLSIWYPLICTLSWVHERRQSTLTSTSSQSKKSASSPTTTKSVKQRAKTIDNTSKASPFPEAKQRLRAATTKRRIGMGIFPKTTPAKNAAQKATEPPASPTSSIQTTTAAAADPEASTKYWLQYWGVYALVQCFGHFCSMVPVFGRFVARHPFVLSLCAEFKLLFFIWLFCMEIVLGNTGISSTTSTSSAAEGGDNLLAEAMPLRLLHRHVTPVMLELEAVLAEAVSEETWKTVVHSKVQRLLEVLVMIRFLSEVRKDWLLHVLDESRTLLLPSLSLLMPGFITQFGVAYVQFLVPSAKSARCTNNKNSDNNNEADELLYLQYWILHCLVSGCLTWFSTLLWWIPFSTHATFVLWCHLSFPQTISEYYAVLEMELIAFGILQGEATLQMHETRTAQLITAVTKRLPSANEYDNDDNDNHNDTINQNQAESSRPHGDEHTIDPSISVDSQRVEVSIMEEPPLRKANDDEPLVVEEEQDDEDSNYEEKANDDEPLVEEEDDEDSNYEEDSVPGLANKTSTTHDDDSISDNSSVENKNTTNDTQKVLRRSTRNRKTKPAWVR
jgi:hypothetical protein